MYEGSIDPGETSTSPLDTASISTPERLTAVLVPAIASFSGFPCTWMPRTRAVAPRGMIATSSPDLTPPDMRVPVTTVPNPFIVKTRSIGRRKIPDRRAPLDGGGHLVQRCDKRIDPQALHRRDADDRAALEKRPPGEVAHLLGDQVDHLGLDHVDLRYDHQPRADPQEASGFAYAPGSGA